MAQRPDRTTPDDAGADSDKASPGPRGRPDRDPGDAVPPGVAPAEPAPLTEADRRAKRQLEQLPKRGG